MIGYREMPISFANAKSGAPPYSISAYYIIEAPNALDF